MSVLNDDLLADTVFATEDEAEPDITAPHWKKEHFIPLRRVEMVRLLRERFGPAERGIFDSICEMLAATVHHEFHLRLEDLKQLYAVFNPDSITVESSEANVGQRDDVLSKMFLQFASLMQKANYQRLSRQQLVEAMGAASDWGLRLQVDMDVFRRLEVFARGDVIARRVRRRWQNFFLAEELQVPIYRRLVVAFFLQPHHRLDPSIDTEHVYLKLFKNIPKQDVDMLLPGGHFQMTWLDQTKILIPTISGIALATFKLVVAWVFAPLILLGFVGGTIGYGVKSFLGYLRTKDRYQLALTRSLYYQNLDNNAGVLFRLLDEAEEQECREAILAYALLSTAGSGRTEQELDQDAESLLAELLGFEVDFEVHDALQKLERFQCATRIDSLWHAASPDVALNRLRAGWGRFSEDRNK